MIRFAFLFQVDLKSIRPILEIEERYISVTFDT